MVVCYFVFPFKSFSLLLKTLVILKAKDRGSSCSTVNYCNIEQQTTVEYWAADSHIFAFLSTAANLVKFKADAL